MAIEYSWSISKIEKTASFKDKSDVITRVSFVYEGVDGEHKGSFHGIVPIPRPEVGEDDKVVDSFIEMADLKESDVIEWAKANHPIEHMQDVISRKISEQKEPQFIDVQDLPWGSEEEEEE